MAGIGSGVGAYEAMVPTAPGIAGGQLPPPVGIDDPEAPTCWICLQPGTLDDHLFQPCACKMPVHTSCLREWRYAGINPANAVRCVNCTTPYRFSQPDADKRRAAEKIYKRDFRKKVIGFALLFCCFVLGMIFLIASILYVLDPQKNVPVFARYLCASAIGGVPDDPHAAEEEYRVHYKDPYVPVWPFYLSLGFVIFSVLILLFNCFFPLGPNQPRQRRKDCRCECCERCDCCYCYDPYLPCYCYYTPTPNCNCTNCACGDCDCNASSCNPDCSCEGGDNEAMMAVLLVALVIVVLAVAVAAVFLLLGVVGQQYQVMYASYKKKMRALAAEQSGERAVLPYDPAFQAPCVAGAEPPPAMAHGPRAQAMPAVKRAPSQPPPIQRTPSAPPVSVAD